MKVAVLWLVLLLGPFITRAQTGTLKGTITYQQQPLEFATIALLKTSFSTQADSTGKFSMEGIPAGNYQLRVSYVGYENLQQEVTIQQGSVTEIPVSLTPLNSRLKELVVTGTLKAVSKLQSVTPVDVYSAKYFQRNPTSNLFDALQGVNGLFADVDNGVSNTTDIQINGLEGNYTMYVIDGVPAMGGLAGMYALNAFPASLIDKVEIVKGASSTIYGSDAIAGVVNIKTRDPFTAPRFTADISMTSMLEANTSFSASFRTRKVASLFALSTENMEYRWDINNDNFTDIPLIHRVNAYNKWALARPDNKVANFYMRYLYEDRFAGEKNLPSAWRGSTRYYSEAVTTQQWQTGIQYQLPGIEKVLLLLDYSGHLQDGNYGYTPYHGMQHTGFAQLTWTKQIDRMNEMLIGASYRALFFADNSSLTEPDETGYARLSHIGGVFMEDEIHINPMHTLLVGARFDYSSRSGPVIMPRAGYKYSSKDEKNILRIAGGTGYRMPNVLNEGFGAMNGSRTIEIEEPLKAEVAVNATANYTRVQELKGGILALDASVFYTYFFNFIETDYESDPTSIIYSNNQGTTAAGVSLNADFTFNYPLKIGIGLTYTHTYELEEGEDGDKEKQIPPHVPPVVGNFYLSYNFPAPQLSIDWTGTMVAPMNLVTVPDDYRSAKSPFYTIQNIQLTKKFKKGIELYVGIKNLFNFIQKDPLLRPFDPYNRFTNVDNPYNYRFDTTYGFTTTQGIKGFAGFRYILP